MDVKQYIEDIMQKMETSPLHELPQKNDVLELQNQLQILHDKLEQPLRVALVGEVKAGKSTLINAFAGGSVSPTDATETTACIMKIGYSPEEQAAIIFKDGRIEKGSVAEIYQILQNHHNEQAFFADCDCVEIRKPLSGLRNIHLVDTPGLATITQANENRTVDYFQEIDVVLWVFNGNYLGQADVNDSLRKIMKMGKPVVAVINRIDQVNGDPQELVDYLDDSVGIYLEGIYPLSAKEAFIGVMENDLKKCKHSGFTALYKYLVNEIDRNVEEVQIESIQSSAQVLEKQLAVLHQEAYKAIELCINTYGDLEVEIITRGEQLKAQTMVSVREWLQHEFLADTTKRLYDSINEKGMFSLSKGSNVQTKLQAELADEKIRQEVEQYIQQKLQVQIQNNWKKSLDDLDASLATAYNEQRDRQLNTLANIPLIDVPESGMDTLTNSVVTATVAGTSFAAFTAVAGPAAAQISIGAAVGAFLPPALFAGAAVGIIGGILKSQNARKKEREIIQVAIQQTREKVADNFLPFLETYLDTLCNDTQQTAKEDFINRTFPGCTVEKLQDIHEKLSKITRQELSILGSSR